MKNAPRPFRFGLLSFSEIPSREAWINKARDVEAAGFSSLLLPDHIGVPLGPIAAMATAAQATTHLRVGSYVFGNDFRNPVFLAQEAASVDLLSDGRLELGLGTGFYRVDYQQSGIPFDAPDTRVSRLEEAVQVIKGFFADKPFDFPGRFYTVTGLNGQPKPIQKPHPPIMIGGGSKRVLSLAAREADIVSFNIKTTREGGFDMSSTTPAATAQKVAWVREAAGERFNSLELNLVVPFLAVTNQRRQSLAQIAEQWGLTTDDANLNNVLMSPSVLVGTVDQIVEDLQLRRECYGMSYVTVFDPWEAFVPVIERLAGQ